MTTSSNSSSTSFFQRTEHMKIPIPRFLRRPSPTSNPPPARHPPSTSSTTDTTDITTHTSPNPTSSPLTVIELFQSQGCSSCPPANANLLSLLSSSTSHQASSSSPSSILFLTYQVTYWNHLGWPDTFGSRASDERQRDYVRRLGLRSAFTPQVVVNGVASGVGSTRTDLNRVLKEGEKAVGESRRRGRVEVVVQRQEGNGSGNESGKALVSVVAAAPQEEGQQRGRAAVRAQGEELEVWLVTYDPAEVDVKVSRGENAGRTLPHVNVVKGIERLGTLSAGDGGEFVVSTPSGATEQAILVQDGRGGAILGAARV